MQVKPSSVALVHCGGTRVTNRGADLRAGEMHTAVCVSQSGRTEARLALWSPAISVPCPGIHPALSPAPTAFPRLPWITSQINKELAPKFFFQDLPVVESKRELETLLRRCSSFNQVGRILRWLEERVYPWSGPSLAFGLCPPPQSPMPVQFPLLPPPPSFGSPGITALVAPLDLPFLQASLPPASSPGYFLGFLGSMNPSLPAALSFWTLTVALFKTWFVSSPC